MATYYSEGRTNYFRVRDDAAFEAALETMTTKTQDLQTGLAQFTTTETWHRHSLNRRLLWTDGAQYFADQAEAWWFIDAVALGVYGKPGPIPLAVPEQDHFGIVLLDVGDGKATIQVRSDYDENDDTAGHLLWHTPIHSTDCPEGIWKFYLAAEGEHVVLLTPNEY